MTELIALAAIALMTSAVAAVAAADAASDRTGPDDWRFVSSREEITPRSQVRANGDGSVLVIAGNGSAISDGRWVKIVALPAGQKNVRFSARFRASNVEMTARNIVAALVWLDEHGKETANADFASTAGAADAQGWREINAVFPVPAKATQVQMDLCLRWSPAGEVEFRDARIEAAPTPAPRMVKIASVNHRPRGTKSGQENLEQFAKLIDEAGANKADIICLPEGATLIGTGKDYISCAEPIPGPSSEFLGKVAAKNHLYVVAGLYEREDKTAYNTSVLIGRDGKLIGKYRKICLPRGESDGGLAPGSDYPVFDTDFGKVGMMICWDVSYPEIARELAARGAEMIVMPIWGGNETLCKARAIENQIPLVISSYDLRSAIYDQAGDAKAIAKDANTCVVYAEMNLAEPMNWKWTGHWRDRIWIEGPVRKDAAASPVASKLP